MSAVVFTKQFKAGNSQAVRLPYTMAFPPKTELKVYKEGNKIVIEPKEETLEKLASLFAAVGKHHSGVRPEFEAAERDCS